MLYERYRHSQGDRALHFLVIVYGNCAAAKQPMYYSYQGRKRLKIAFCKLTVAL
jgi:hypothetical protein